jgi:hypothetical protein
VVNSGTPQLVSGGTAASVPSDLVAVSGNPVDDGIFSNTENTRLPFFSLFSSRVDMMPLSRQASWLIICFPFGVILGVLFTLAIRTMLSFVVGLGIPFALADSGGLIQDWWLLVWGIAIVAVWGFEKWHRQN